VGRAGFAASSVVWLQMRSGLGFRCWNLWVCSLARYQSFWFLGIFNTWIPLPVSWAYGVLLRWHGSANNMLKVPSNLSARCDVSALHDLEGSAHLRKLGIPSNSLRAPLLTDWSVMHDNTVRNFPCSFCGV
jgi:hypothetical protein